MTDSDPPELSSALLQWVQAFQTSKPVNSWSDLRDGQILWEILYDIDPDYFTESVPEQGSEVADSWIPRWQNLKHINRLVTAYVRDVCGVEETMGRDVMPDLKAIATEGSMEDTVKLLKVILRAAMYSPNSNQRMGRIVVGLGPDVAKPIAAAMAAMEEADQQRIEARQRTETEGSSELDTSTDSEQAGSTRRTSVERDHELEQEEKLIQAYKLIHQLETSNAKAASELEALRSEKNSLQSAFDSFKNEVENEGRRKAELASVKQLQIKADRDRDYISELETELENMRMSMQGQERQIERFKAADGEKQKLRDDVQLLRAERDELLQKNRANENLKKKIHTLQDVERTAASLREELKEAQEQLTQMERLKEQVAALQKANAENMTTIANEEQEIFDQKTSKKRLEHEFKMLAGKWEVARERQGRDHETIRELEDRIRMLEEGRGSDDEGSGGLEDEMEKSERSKEARRNKSVDLSQSADYSLLQQNLDSLRARNSKLEQEYLDLLQDKLGLETAVEDLRSPDREPEENVPFLEQRKKLQATESKLAELRNTCFSITAALSKAQERLAATEGVADVEGNAQYQELVARYDELHKHSEGLEAGLTEQRSLLRHALLAQASLAKDPEEVRQSNEYKIVLQQLEAVRVAEEESDVLANTATSLTDKIEAGRKSSLEAEKRAAALSTTIADLKAQLETAAQAPTPAANADPVELANMRRENLLMTSAWFDLSSRVQSNTVMIGRRKESPKSWIGQQRMLVSPGVGQVRR